MKIIRIYEWVSLVSQRSCAMIVPRTKFLRVAEDYVGDRERLPLGSIRDPLRQNLLRLLASLLASTTAGSSRDLT
jgi:hypothetical protein